MFVLLFLARSILSTWVALERWRSNLNQNCNSFWCAGCCELAVPHWHIRGCCLWSQRSCLHAGTVQPLRKFCLGGVLRDGQCEPPDERALLAHTGSHGVLSTSAKKQLRRRHFPPYMTNWFMGPLVTTPMTANTSFHIVLPWLAQSLLHGTQYTCQQSWIWGM